MSCMDEYKKFIKDNNYNNKEHYIKYVLPDILELHPSLLKNIQKNDTAELPKKLCRQLIQKYIKKCKI